MAVRKSSQKALPSAPKQKALPAAPAAPASTNTVVEQRLVAFAEQLGTLVGTVQAKAEGWMDSEALSKEITRIRDSAAELLEQVSGQVTGKTSKAAAKPAPVAKAPAGRGPVDAPGKSHRKPLPQPPIAKRMPKPIPRAVLQPALKTGRHGGRG